MIQLQPQSVFHRMPKLKRRLDGLVECEREFIVASIFLRRAIVGLENFDMDEYTIEDVLEDLEERDITWGDDVQNFLDTLDSMPADIQLQIAKELSQTL